MIYWWLILSRLPLETSGIFWNPQEFSGHFSTFLESLKFLGIVSKIEWFSFSSRVQSEKYFVVFQNQKDSTRRFFKYIYIIYYEISQIPVKIGIKIKAKQNEIKYNYTSFNEVTTTLQHTCSQINRSSLAWWSHLPTSSIKKSIQHPPGYPYILQ